MDNLPRTLSRCSGTIADLDKITFDILGSSESWLFFLVLAEEFDAMPVGDAVGVPRLVL